MGGFLSSNETIISDVGFLQNYQRVNLKDIQDVMQNFKALHGSDESKMALNVVEFEEIFCPLCDDPEEHFMHFDARKTGKVDAFEVFAVAIVFCKDDIMNKTRALFDMFDFDGSSEISRDELVILMMSTTRGLCKVADLARPSVSQLGAIASRAFSRIDVDGNEKISFLEFQNWFQDQHDVVQYLKRFVGVRLITDAQKQYDEFLSRMMKSFISASVKKEVEADTKSHDIKCPVKHVRKIFSEIDSSPPNAKEIDQYLSVMGANPNDLDDSVALCDFSSAISSFIAYDVADDNASDSLDFKELKVLLWLMRGAEPSNQQVKLLLASMDEDHNGTISRLEWVSYMAVIDKSTGVLYFNAQMRHLFDECDEDGSGSISRTELLHSLKAIVTRTIHSSSSNIDELEETKYALIDSVLNDLAVELVELIDKSGNQFIEWREFKVNIDLVQKRIAEVKAYVHQYILDCNK